MRNVFRHSPARALSPAEHATVAEWLAAAGDIASAYVSSRQIDDPALYRCVVIISKPDDGPSHLIHAPSDQDVWILFTLGQRSKIQTCPTLAGALNSVRPVLLMDADHLPSQSRRP
jgi:hypothetical protein